MTTGSRVPTVRVARRRFWHNRYDCHTTGFAEEDCSLTPSALSSGLKTRTGAGLFDVESLPVAWTARATHRSDRPSISVMTGRRSPAGRRNGVAHVVQRFLHWPSAELAVMTAVPSRTFGEVLRPCRLASAFSSFRPPSVPRPAGAAPAGRPQTATVRFRCRGTAGSSWPLKPT